MKHFVAIAFLLGTSVLLSGCGVAKTTGKIVTAPVKLAYKTGEVAGKGVYKTGELAGKSVYYTGKGVYKTGEFAGKTAVNVAKGVYYIGTVPVEITDRALDTTSKVLTVTTQALDVGGKVVTVSRQIQATELEAELAAIKGATNIVKVFVDAVG